MQSACQALREKVVALASNDAGSPLRGVSAKQIECADGMLFAAADRGARDSFGAVAARAGGSIEARGEAKPGSEEEHYASRSFGAVFTEVRIDPELGLIRVPRVVATYSVGRLLNAKTALSQLQGGIVNLSDLALGQKSQSVNQRQVCHGSILAESQCAGCLRMGGGAG